MSIGADNPHTKLALEITETERTAHGLSVKAGEQQFASAVAEKSIARYLACVRAFRMQTMKQLVPNFATCSDTQIRGRGSRFMRAWRKHPEYPVTAMVRTFRGWDWWVGKMHGGLGFSDPKTTSLIQRIPHGHFGPPVNY